MKSTYVLVALAVLIAAVLGYGAGHYTNSKSNPYQSITREGGYQYVNPLLSCDIAEDTEYIGFETLKSKLESTTRSMIATGKAKRISVYFRDMNYGAWTGVDADDTYIPASLLKVPLMIAFFREFEQDPSLRNKEVFLPNGNDLNAEEYSKSQNHLALGQNYSVQNLIGALIKGSDNNASAVLNQMVATSSLNEVYSQFALPGITNDTSETMSPKSYMRAFRILYNASYISRGSSQSALELLSKTDFNSGIVAGVSAGTPVAHKFGERTVSAIDPVTKTSSLVKRELHDCGIVYYPRSPYGICVMTEGSSFEDLEGVITAVSKIAYEAVQKGILSANQ